MTKMTNAVALSYVLTNCEMPAEVREKVEKMLEQVKAKSNAIHKPTAKQVENEGFKSTIVEVLADGASLTITEIVDAIGVEGLTNQRVSAIVRQMVEGGILKREEVKRKAYFSKA